MKLVLSPAKSLDFETKIPTTKTSEALLLKEAEQINKQLKRTSAKELSELMKISEALSQLNYERNQNWELPFSSATSRQAVYAFNGDVYRGLDAYALKGDKIDTLQNTVRILSGLYGLLKPLDQIMPYRLEMGTKFPVGKSKNLYDFWKTTLTDSLNKELKEDELFLNLASNEYFKAVDKKALKVPVVTVNFKEFKNGAYKTIAFYAKYARGCMARYVIETNAKTIDDIKAFNYENYGFSEELSSESSLVFIR